MKEVYSSLSNLSHGHQSRNHQQKQNHHALCCQVIHNSRGFLLEINPESDSGCRPLRTYSLMRRLVDILELTNHWTRDMPGTKHCAKAITPCQSLSVSRRICLTVKMEILCSRFYAVISGTSADIDVGSSGECLESKNWQFIFFSLNDLFRDLHLSPWMKASTIWFFGCCWIGMDQEYSKKVTKWLILWSFAFPLSTMEGTQVDELLDVESQKHFTAISILSY